MTSMQLAKRNWVISWTRCVAKTYCMPLPLWDMLLYCWIRIDQGLRRYRERKQSRAESCCVFYQGLGLRARGAFHSVEKAYEIFAEQKDFYGFLMDFSCKQKDFCQRRTRFFGVKCPSFGPCLSLSLHSKEPGIVTLGSWYKSRDRAVIRLGGL